mgnify:CR=1 FL=1
MAYSSITKPGLHFSPVTYTGNGSTQSITGVGFQPDWVWIKALNNSRNSRLTDVINGVGKNLFSDANSVLTTNADGVTAFGADGFSVGSGNGFNANTETHVAWNWKTQNAQGSSNTDGTINTTYTSVNTTAGFSISQYEGTGSNATFGHGLGVAPQMVIVKNIDATQNWFVYHQGIGATKVIYLDLANAQQTLSQGWNNTAPTSSVVSIGTEAGVNQSGSTHIAYCFAEKIGYSKFGSYTGNGNSDGSFIYTGFKPAWLMYKTTGSDNWQMLDNKRNSFNVMDKNLFANLSNAETTSSNYNIDFVSNGFKLRTSHSSINGSGTTYIYMAFAAAPLVGSNNVPCVAR